MKYRELLNNITEVAKKHPNINSTFIGDVYELNHRNDVDYCAFVITNGTHRVNSDETIDYSLNLFYVDRLTADEGNRTMIHSAGIDFMNSLLRAVEKLGVVVVEHTENVFNERFNDVCAGVYATVVFRCEIDECGQTIEIISYDELKVLKVTENGIYDGLFKQVDVNVATKEPVLEGLSVINNGTYTPKTGVDGFNSVEVNVLPKLETLNATDNGTYTPSTGKDGFDSVTVDVPKEKHNVTSKSITANGVYNSTGDEVWNEVSVNVPDKTFNKASVTKEYTANGQYSIATPDGYDGISDVSVNVNVASSGGFDTKLLRALDLTSYDENMHQIRIIDVSGNDFSNLQSLQMVNVWNSSLKTVNMSNCVFTSKLSTLNYMFQGCGNIETIDFTNCDFSHSDGFVGSFDSSSLTTINCDGLKLPDANMDNTGLSLTTKLTVDSIVGLLNALPQSTHNYSFQIGADNIAKLSDDQKAIATNKGWTLV